MNTDENVGCHFFYRNNGKQDVDLAYLAQSLQHFERRAPEAWCAVGNCFSLQKDHETAVKFFRRVRREHMLLHIHACVLANISTIQLISLELQALQLNPSFAYAHTLQGHEFVSNDELDKVRR